MNPNLGQNRVISSQSGEVGGSLTALFKTTHGEGFGDRKGRPCPPFVKKSREKMLSQVFWAIIDKSSFVGGSGRRLEISRQDKARKRLRWL